MPGARELAGELAERALWLPDTSEPLLSMVEAESSQPPGPGNSQTCRTFPGLEGAAPRLGGVQGRTRGAAQPGLPRDSADSGIFCFRPNPQKAVSESPPGTSNRL